MITGYVVTALAVSGLFLIKNYPAPVFALWTCTNGYWLFANLAGGNIDQAIMFAAFTVSCVIQFSIKA